MSHPLQKRKAQRVGHPRGLGCAALCAHKHVDRLWAYVYTIETGGSVDKTKHAIEKAKRPTKINYTTEATAYLGGLFGEFQEQTQKYHSLTAQLLSLEAQIELAEKTLCLMRDHLAMAIEKTEGAVPNDWEKVLHKVRFVGVRLADACNVLLQEKKRLTSEQLLHELNNGMYRFRTNAPLREIHAALLKQSFVEKRGSMYFWIGKPEQQMPLRMRVVSTSQVIDQTPVKEGATDSAQRKERKV